jgi:hypothetical protein
VRQWQKQLTGIVAQRSKLRTADRNKKQVTFHDNKLRHLPFENAGPAKAMQFKQIVD